MPEQTIASALMQRKSLKSLDVSRCVLILVICSLVGLGFYFLGLSEANIITIYILGILVISSVTRRRIYGMVSSVVGVLLFNCLFADPRFTLLVYDPQYTITIAIMLVASLISSYVMTMLRKQLEREKLETRRSEVLLETSQSLIQAQSGADICQVAVLQLHRLRGQAAVVFPLEEKALGEPLIRQKEGASSLEFFMEDKGRLERWLETDSGREPFIQEHPRCRAVYFRVQSGDTVFAVAGVMQDSKNAMEAFERNLMFAMLDEIAMAMERNRLHTFNERIARQAEEERLRANLLRTISHDLRTPLTSISGNADILLTGGGQIEPQRLRQVYQNIYDDAEWLIGLVENLLFITRMENGTMSIHLEPELLQEIIPEALHHMSKRMKTHTVTLELPEELLMVRLDARLFMQVIVNVLDNALKYTPPGSSVAVRAFCRGDLAVVQVADNGRGISPEDKQRVFDMFYTADNKSGDGRRGIGLGLSLCQSIMAAHGGRISLKDNHPSGTVVELTLQLEEVHYENQYTGD